MVTSTWPRLRQAIARKAAISDYWSGYPSKSSRGCWELVTIHKITLSFSIESRIERSYNILTNDKSCVYRSNSSKLGALPHFCWLSRHFWCLQSQFLRISLNFYHSICSCVLHLSLYRAQNLNFCGFHHAFSKKKTSEIPSGHQP